VRVVINDFKVLESVFQDGGRLTLYDQFWKGTWFARQLLPDPIELIDVNVAIASGPNEIARLQVALLRHHMGYLRRIHNFALDMNWLPWSILPKRQWPKVKFKEKRAITMDEHQRIITAEVNPERKTLYQLCWHLGASQPPMTYCRRF
jgi:hypothetical protein